MVKLQLVNNHRCLDCLRSIGTRKNGICLNLITSYDIQCIMYGSPVAVLLFFYGKNQEEEQRYNHSARDP